MLVPVVVSLPAPPQAAAVTLTLAGPWQVKLSPGTVKVGSRTVTIRSETVLDVEPATLFQVRDERIAPLPAYNDQAPGWARGARLARLITFETTAPDMLVPGTLKLKPAAGDAAPFVAGKDYGVDERWGTLGALPGGAIKPDQAVYADYDCGLSRIDSIVVDRQGRAALRKGVPHVATPQPIVPGAGETVVANVWVPGRLASLNADSLFPILEPVYAAPRHAKPPAAELLPKTWAKLQAGQPVHVLAWGDSVTAGGQASDEAHRWQSVFVDLLRKRFPNAQIKLTTAGWGGRNSDSFLQEPPESPYNFERAVIQPHPDLVVMEFVNDAWMNPEVVEQKYSALLKQFTDAGIEWAILTPHLVWPEWMGSKTVKVEADPRPYVAGVRAFCARHHVALADASLRWCHLAKEGVPYTTLLCNSLNHPNDYGHRMFAESLMELFR